MTNGIEIFKKYFSSYREQYVLIGGTACDLLMEDVGLQFRPTEDIDVVLIVEALSTDFAKAFWSFIQEGGYQARLRSNGRPEFYRFVDPKDPSFPAMIELFARPDNKVDVPFASHLTPIHIDDDTSSLSAILLNEPYYRFLLDGRIDSDGISVLDAEHLVPMKMKAWLDLREKRDGGIHVNDRDLRKHRQDVFRLFPLIRSDTRITVPVEIYDDINKFLRIVADSSFDPQKAGIQYAKEVVIDTYKNLYVKDN